MTNDLEVNGVTQLSGLTPAEANSPEMDLVSKKNAKAFIFGFVPDKNGKSTGNPRCHLYELEVLVKDSNTRNLYSHLRYKTSVHPQRCAGLQAATRTKEKEADDDSRQPPWKQHEIRPRCCQQSLRSTRDSLNQ